MKKINKKNKFFRVSLISGLLFLFLSALIYNFVNNTFFYSSFQEILGIGLFFIVIAFIFKKTRIKLA